MKVAYTQQFTPEQTPLRQLLPILRQTADKSKAKNLKKAIASAFFKEKASPDKLAANTLIALRYYGIIDAANGLTDFGKQLVECQGKDREDDAHRLLARRILFDFDGIAIVETLKEMNTAGLSITLKSLPSELRQRGFEVSDNSSDLSGVFGWLRQAGVLNKNYQVTAGYEALVGASAATLEAMKGLSTEQILFLKSMVALNVREEWTPYNTIARHAEELYSGELRYNWKEIPSNVLRPLETRGLITIRKKAKKDPKTPEGRGGKSADVKPTATFEKEIAEPILSTLYRAAGYTDVRTIRGKALSDIVADIKQKDDTDKSGKALEYLAVRLCQMLDLEFMGLRERDVDIAAGGEVDAMMHSSRLVYSRWQLQCKVGDVHQEAAAKEMGQQIVSLANVILIVGTGSITKGARDFRRKIVSTTNLNIIFIDGDALERIIKDNSTLVEILRQQARDALSLKPTANSLGLKRTPPTGQAGSGTPTPSDDREEDTSAKPAKAEATIVPAYTTDQGRLFCGNALDVLPQLIQQGYRAKLIMTSPPFALVRKKAYGNEDADDYVRWFEQFIPLLKQILEPNGSLVIDIGGVWLKGLPVKSIYQYKLLVTLCESGFYLAQDFYHYNPARLPSPAEWVTVRRIRVKDAMNNVWWLTLEPFADADNRRILTPYSDSMKSLLKNGYKPGLRPSGHNVSDKFSKDNGGAIPPNLLQFSNTDSQGYYLRRCKEENIKPHPARFVQPLPEFFIKFLTVPGDLVLDTFAGSNVTGAAAEALGRQWISIELDPEYVAGSKFRFEPGATLPPQSGTKVSAQESETSSLPLFNQAEAVIPS